MTSSMLKYGIVISLTAAFFIAELVVGIYAGSLSLQTDAFHMLSDLLALCIGAGTLMLVSRKTHHRFTYGWGRGEIIGGLVNSVFLLAICFLLAIDCISKFASMKDSQALGENINLVLIIGGCGLGINLIGIALFHFGKDATNSHGHSHSHSHSHESAGNLLNSAVLLHIIGDALGSIAVIISGLCIKYIHSDYKYYADPIASLAIIIFITIGSVRILSRCIRILLHHWAGEAPRDIVDRLLQIDGVMNVHDLHIWSLDGTYSIATLHVRLKQRTNVKRVTRSIKSVLHDIGIHCSTIQPEWGKNCNELVCNEGECESKKCCKVGTTECVKDV